MHPQFNVTTIKDVPALVAHVEKRLYSGVDFYQETTISAWVDKVVGTTSADTRVSCVTIKRVKEESAEVRKNREERRKKVPKKGKAVTSGTQNWDERMGQWWRK